MANARLIREVLLKLLGGSGQKKAVPVNPIQPGLAPNPNLPGRGAIGPGPSVVAPAKSKSTGTLEKTLRLREQRKGKGKQVAVREGPIPAPRDTSRRDAIVDRMRRGVIDREEDGFSMTENEFDRINIEGENEVDAWDLRFPIQTGVMPGQFDPDPVMNSIVGALTFQDGNIVITGSRGKTVHVHELTEESLRKIRAHPKTGEVSIMPQNIEKLPEAVLGDVVTQARKRVAQGEDPDGGVSFDLDAMLDDAIESSIKGQ